MKKVLSIGTFTCACHIFLLTLQAFCARVNFERKTAHIIHHFATIIDQHNNSCQ